MTYLRHRVLSTGSWRDHQPVIRADAQGIVVGPLMGHGVIAVRSGRCGCGVQLRVWLWLLCCEKEKEVAMETQLELQKRLPRRERTDQPFTLATLSNRSISREHSRRHLSPAPSCTQPSATAVVRSIFTIHCCANPCCRF